MNKTMGNYKDKLKSEKKRFGFIYLSMVLILIFVCLASITAGRADINIIETTRIILNKIVGLSMPENIEAYKISIIWDIRLPRVLMGALVGAGLAVAGAIFQSVLRNPLADPYTIGVSTGAAFGGSLAIYLNIFILSKIAPVAVFAFIGAVATLYVVMKISKVSGIRTKSSLILSGIIVSSILSAGISFLKAISGEEVAAIIFWLMGNLSSKTWAQVFMVFPVMMICILVANKLSIKLDIMSLGRTEAESLGVDYERTSLYYLVVASLITAVSVSVSGIIGFVGLVVPHLVRFIFSSKNQYVLPISALLGAILLVIADSVSRVMLNVELPVGILTTLLGGPFFIYIYMKKNKGGLGQ